MTTLTPFANETDSITLDGLTIENRLDRLSLYGSFTITRDQAGLALARELQTLLAATITQLESENLVPHTSTTTAIDEIDNPFA